MDIVCGLTLVICDFAEAMKHYICTGGCEGESNTPGVCQAEECKKEGEPLTPCDCEDGLHEGAEEKNEEEEAE